MTENEAMEEETEQTLHATLVRDERWVEGALGFPTARVTGERCSRMEYKEETLQALSSCKLCSLFRLDVLETNLEGITQSGFEVFA